MRKGREKEEKKKYTIQASELISWSVIDRAGSGFHWFVVWTAAQTGRIHSLPHAPCFNSLISNEVSDSTIISALPSPKLHPTR